MPAYRFQAADAAGVLHRGIVDADSSRQARAIIRERGQTPIEVVALSAEQNAGHINLGGRLKDADLALCTRQLSSLLTARLPLEKALNAVVEQAESARVRERFAAVRSDVVSGQTLTAAMAKFPRDFPDTYRALISAGEQSGDLAQVMSRLAAYVENRTQLVSKVKMAFTYPIIVAVVAVLVIIALLTYVVPQVVQVFNQTRQDLPLLTLILIRTSDFIRNWGWLVLLGLGGAWAAFHYSLKAPTARLSFHSKLLNMPMFGRLVRGINAARFASTLAILTASGVPLIRALEAGADTLNNTAMIAAVLAILAFAVGGSATDTMFHNYAICGWVMAGIVGFLLIGMHMRADNRRQAENFYIENPMQYVLMRATIIIGSLAVVGTAFEIALWLSKTVG